MTLPKKMPNIILIVLDTARAKNFSCYGYHRPTTPNIDRIAEEGVLYKWCFSPANWTVPSHASLFTGLYPSEHGCHWGNPYLDENLLTLPEILHQAGYHTVGISCNALVSPTTGFAQGFDRFWNLGNAYPFKGAMAPSGFKLKEKLLTLVREPSSSSYFRWFLNKTLARVYASFWSWKTVLTKRALRLATTLFVEKVDAPLFLFINLMQVHGPYQPPRETAGRFGRWGLKFNRLAPKPAQYYALEPMIPEVAEKLTALYDEELFFVDWCIGEFYQQFAARGLLDEAVFVVTSDHGELIGEHGGLFWHMYGLFEEQLHIPLIIRWPKQFNISGIEGKIVQLHDLFATLVNFCDLPFPLPEGSVDLLKGKRECAVAEDVDASLRVKDWAARDPKFDAAAFPFREPAKVFIRLEGATRPAVPVLQPQDKVSLASLV